MVLPIMPVQFYRFADRWREQADPAVEGSRNAGQDGRGHCRHLPSPEIGQKIRRRLDADRNQALRNGTAIGESVSIAEQE